MSEPQTPPASRKSGTPFWVWPLVFVTAGCGLPLGISLLVLRPAIAAAKIDTCLSNLGHLAKAQILYANDHDDCLPLAIRWCDRLQPYVPAGDRPFEFHCPSAPKEAVGYAMN